MQISLSSAAHQVTLALTVKRVEAQVIHKSDWEDDLVDDYYRSIRFVTPDGTVLEVSCSAYNEQDLTIVEVAESTPLTNAKR